MKYLACAVSAAVLMVSTPVWAGADSFEVELPDMSGKQQVQPDIISRVAPGQFSENLLNIQERLAVIGYYPSFKVNGYNDSEMRPAIRKFQRDHALKVDGIFGPHTAVTLNYVTGMLHMVPINSQMTVYDYRLPGYYASYGDNWR